MLEELLQQQYPELMQTMTKFANSGTGAVQPLDDLAYCELSLAIHRLASHLAPNRPEPVCRIAEAHHLRGELREAGKYYRQVLEMDRPARLTDMEQARMLRHAPILYTNPDECFGLMDVAAIHHPNEPLIAYHLFWEDDYNFPDDYEPCDHEQVWVAYDPESDQVRTVWTFFHSRVITTPEAAEEANRKGGRPSVFVQWGTHGSLISGWEKLRDPVHPERTIMDDMRQTFAEVAVGGRLPEHPLKQSWPRRYTGTFDDYTDFRSVLDTSEWLRKKNMMSKTAWSNAVLQQQFLAYNFHPKFDWPFSFC